MFHKRLVGVAIILALLTAFSAEVAVHPSTAHAAGSPHYSISHYVDFRDFSTADSMVKNWAKSDASRIDPPGDSGSCPNNYYGHVVVTVLDFGAPVEDGGAYGAWNWQSQFFNTGTIADLAQDYAISYYGNSGVCSKMWIAIGTNNSYECGLTGYSSGCVYNAGYYFASAVAVAQNYINGLGGDYPHQFVMAGGDDIEYDGTWAWDPYNWTINALNGFAAYTGGYFMIDFGYTQQPCGDYQPNNSCGSGNTGSDGNPIWDYGEVYNVAWGIGKDVPLPEAYNPAGFGYIWGEVAAHSNNGSCADCINAGIMSFWGIMNNDGWTDSNNQYGTFWSNAGNPSQNAFYWDSCQANLSNSTAQNSAPPCY